MMTASTEDQLEAERFARGYLNGFRESLLFVLHHHGFSLSASDLLRIHGTDDKEVVHRWFDRAVMATSIDDVFPPAESTVSRRERPEHASDASSSQRRNTLRSIIEACLAQAYDCGCICGSAGREEKQCTGIHVFRRPCTPDHETFDDIDGVELLFELVDTSRPRDIDAVARARIARGLRRVICIFVHEGEVREWSPATETWLVLDPAGMIIDPVLSVPIPIVTLLEPTQEETLGALAHLQLHRLLPALGRGRQRGAQQGLRHLHLRSLHSRVPARRPLVPAWRRRCIQPRHARRPSVMLRSCACALPSSRCASRSRCCRRARATTAPPRPRPPPPTIPRSPTTRPPPR
jgi:hypothetical protein